MRTEPTNERAQARRTTRPRPARAEVSEKGVARLALYRRVLQHAAEEGTEYLFSHDVAERCGTTSAQVRRDLMAVGFTGHPVYGYELAGLVRELDRFLDKGRTVRMALVGVGNLGRALLPYFNRGKAHATFVAAFDIDEGRVNRTIGGCRSFPMAEMRQVLSETPVDVGVVAVPAAGAQTAAELLIRAGVRSILNFAPVRLTVPENVFVEDVDLGIAIEKAAFFAHAKKRRA